MNIVATLKANLMTRAIQIVPLTSFLLCFPTEREGHVKTYGDTIPKLACKIDLFLKKDKLQQT